MIFNKAKLRLPLILAGTLAVGGLTWMFWPKGSSSDSQIPLVEVKRGDLQVDVLQGGEVRALRNEEMKSEIETTTKIVSIIPEGYLVTAKDIQDKKVLVELDSSDLKTRIQDHDIDFQGTVAAYIEADEAREIQRSENLSSLREERQTALFALMDFEKYFGKNVASVLLTQSSLPESAETFDTFASTLEEESLRAPGESVKASGKDRAPDDTQAPTKLLDEDTVASRPDYTAMLADNQLTDGEAQQRLRQLEDELLLHRSELAVAKQTLEASQRLAEKNFVSKAQLENDQVNFEKVELAVKTAETQLDLFKKYEFPREAEQLLSNYREALNKLRRTVRANRSKMAQVESRFQTAKRRYDMELAKKEDLERQLAACTITAVTPGLVAYGDLNASTSRSYSETIEEGASIRLRQTILTIPDMTRMGVSVKVHESQVKKVRIGQPARITVDAEPGKVLIGSVAELAVLPDSSSSRYTPSLKVYPCTIHIEGTHPWLKPGMNAKVEIIVEELTDIVYVPVQSIEVDQDQHFCYVSASGGLERREVTTGSFNDNFIEVRTGLEAGDHVALSLPKRALVDAAPTAAVATSSTRSKTSAKTAQTATQGADAIASR
ncbi:MAG: efflux RND transporter periplasmic adaptor subunit [Verrucomicrobiales bacterium]|nr:efflux RND transporter periplasmic adaptor subunit [Verrucomicrobiales bacterium]